MTVDTTAPDIASWPPLDDGRRAFGQRLLDWVADGTGTSPRLCLVRGAEGSGKSHLLAWFLTGAEGHPRTTVHAAVPAEGLTAETFAWELGRQLGYGPLPPAPLLDRIALDQRPLLLFVPDLHRAGAGPADLPPADPAALVADLLEPLLSLPHVRTAVEVGESGLLPADGALTIDLPSGTAVGKSSGDAGFAELVAAVPRTSDGRPDWSRAPDGVRRHVLGAALRADAPEVAVRGLLADPGFLVHGAATAITAALADERIPAPGGLRRVWRRAAPQLTDHHPDGTERAALLHTAAVGTDSVLAEYLRPLAQRHWWSAVWARPDLAVTALAAVDGEERLLLAADTTGRLRTYRPDTGAPAAAIGSAPHLRPDAIAPRDARSLLLCDRTGVLLPLAPEDDAAAAVLGHIARHHGSAALAEEEAQVTAVGSDPGNSYAVVGDRGGTLHVWSLNTGQDTPRSRRVHEHPVTAAACLRVAADGPVLVFSAAPDGSVRLWETSADPMPAPVQRRRSQVTALAAADTSAGPVLAVAWSDARIHLWHVWSGRMRVLPLLHACRALALTPEGLLVVGDPQGLYAVRLRPETFREP
ncbi:hypothetical protein SUDANB6_01520 [Streptomyces sp. enrichment culture]|uniref:WD40 repeat domain-containing protein n=1 Tax=Streptomyces sp. enrichment culture TaxID=1795815 RepID=UPI003F54B08B